jgi:hypothetical protein
MARKKSQVEKFREAAKEAGTDNSEDALNATSRRRLVSIMPWYPSLLKSAFGPQRTLSVHPIIDAAQIAR